MPRKVDLKKLPFWDFDATEKLFPSEEWLIANAPWLKFHKATDIVVSCQSPEYIAWCKRDDVDDRNGFLLISREALRDLPRPLLYYLPEVLPESTFNVERAMGRVFRSNYGYWTHSGLEWYMVLPNLSIRF